MNDFILVALFFGGIGGIWWFVSNKLKAVGKGGFVRHLVGAPMGLVGGFILLAIGIAILEPEPEPAAAVAQEEQRSETAETETVDASESTEAGVASEAVAAAGEADLAEREVVDIEALRAEVATMIELGYEMSPFRESSDSGDVAQCMSLMERHQPQADQLRERISAQPDSDFKFHLSMAATDLRRCVSCIPGAESSCDDAATLLDEADQLR